MTLKDFFSNQHLFGKLLGAIFGFLAAGPAGAVIGIIVGNFFDKGLAQHFMRPHWHWYAEKNATVQQLFFKTTFLVMGYIAKASGRVTEKDIAMANQIMDELRLTPEQILEAKQYYLEGKNNTSAIDTYLFELKKNCYYKPVLLHLFVDIQYRVANQTHFTDKKLSAFNHVLSMLNFAKIETQHQFYEDFAYQHQQQKQQRYQQRNDSKTGNTSLSSAYALLNITPNATQQDVKKAFRKMISKHHPDKLIAQGLPEPMIKVANEKTQAITRAYEQICEYKGWH